MPAHILRQPPCWEHVCDVRMSELSHDVIRAEAVSWGLGKYSYGVWLAIKRGFDFDPLTCHDLDLVPLRSKCLHFEMRNFTA